MKIISKIVKGEAGSRVGYSPNGQSISLSTWLTDNDIKATLARDRNVNNIFKVKSGNRYIPLGHKLGDWVGYEGTSVLF